MSRITIRRQHKKTLSSARAAVDRAAAAIENKFPVKTAWEGNTLNFTGSGVNGSIHLAESEIEVNVALDFIRGFLKPLIETEIKRQLDLNFG